MMTNILDRKHFLYIILFATLSCSANTYTVYFSLSQLSQEVVDPYVKRVYELFPGVEIKVEVVKKRSWLGEWVYGEESTRPTSFARLALVYLVGGATFSYLTIVYLIYRVYQLVKILKPLFKNKHLEGYTLSKREQKLLELYTIINEWLKEKNMRLIFPYNQEYEALLSHLQITSI